MFEVKETKNSEKEKKNTKKNHKNINFEEEMVEAVADMEMKYGLEFHGEH